jgi:hypothetical protein
VQQPTTAQIRAWARERGLAVPERGALPAHVVEAYTAAHRRGPDEAVPDEQEPVEQADPDVPPPVRPADLAPAPPVALAAPTTAPTAARSAAHGAAPGPLQLRAEHLRGGLPRRAPGWRGRRSTTVVIALLIALTLAAAALFLLLRAEQPAGPGGGAAGEVTFDAVRLGDCTAEIPTGVTVTVRVLPCSEPHEGEVYARFELSGVEFPGAVEVARLALAGCQREALAALPPGDQTRYDLISLAPSEQTWGQGDRTVSCVLSDPTDALLVGSVLDGTARREAPSQPAPSATGAARQVGVGGAVNTDP